MLIFAAMIVHVLLAECAEAFRMIVYLNPLTLPIVEVRNLPMWGKLHDFGGLAVYGVAALVITWLSLLWFQKTRVGFADAL